MRKQLTEFSEIVKAFQLGKRVYDRPIAGIQWIGNATLKSYEFNNEFWIDIEPEKTDIEKVKEIIKTGYVANGKNVYTTIGYVMYESYKINTIARATLYLPPIDFVEFIEEYHSITREQFLGIEE